MAPPLSTTSMLGMLNKAKIDDFVQTVNDHMENNPKDEISALKVVSTVASFAFKNSLPPAQSGDVISCLVKCVAAVVSSGKEDVVKDTYIKLYHVMARLVRQEQLHEVVSFCPAFLQLSGALVEPTAVVDQAYMLYGLLWNLASTLSPTDESGQRAKVHVTFFALRFLICAKTSDKFTLHKLEDRLKSFLRPTLTCRDMAPSLPPLLVQETLLLLEDTVWPDLARWRLWLHLLELSARLRLDQHNLCLRASVRLFGTAHCAEIRLVEGLLDTVASGSPAAAILEQPSLQLSSPTLPSLVSLMDCLIPSLSSPSLATLQAISRLALALTSSPLLLPAAPRLLTNLLGHLLTSLRSPGQEVTDSSPLVTTSCSLVDQFSSCLSLLPSTPDSKVHLTNLASHSYSLSATLYNAKLFPPCRSLLETSLTSLTSLASLEPSKRALARPRYKLLAEVLWRLGQYREALVSLGRGLVTVLQEEEAGLVPARLQEAAKAWLQVKREWQKALGEAGDEEVHTISLTSLATEGSLGRVTGAQTCQLGRAEVTWYRGPYSPGGSLLQSWVSAAGSLVKVSQEPRDRGMVLLEQTWVFWLGDNTEDLEMGARCAEKAAMLLAGSSLGLGLALYWRFMCEHRMLEVQIQEAVEREETSRSIERKEREGLLLPGQEVQEQEPTPAFMGLQLEVQEKLAAFLEQAVTAWSREEVGPSEWMGSRTLLDFMLGLAWEQERLCQGSGRAAFLLARRTAQRLGEREHEVMAAAELYRIEGRAGGGQVEELLLMARELEEAKQSNVAGAQVGLVLAELLLSQGEVSPARSLVAGLMRDPTIRHNSLRWHLLEGEVRLLASRIKQRPGEWVQGSAGKHQEVRASLELAGPLELAQEAWKLATTAAKWAEADLRTPSSQEPGLLWLVPRLACLQLRCVAQICRLFKMIGAPRELKCHLKWGLRLSQTLCLPLRAAALLVELADCYLLCDDDAAAGAQLAGVDFVLQLETQQGRRKREQVTGKDEHVVQLPGQTEVQAVTASPALSRASPPSPAFLQHPSSCPCSSCSCPALHSVLLRFCLTMSAASHMAGEREAAERLAMAALDMVPGLLARTARAEEERGAAPGTLVAALREELVQGLQGSLESQGSARAWAQCKELLERQEEQLGLLPTHRLRAAPELLLRRVEQGLFSGAAEARMAEVEEQEAADLSQNMSRLELEERGEAVGTPSAAKRADLSTRGAPSKRALPSIGPGDATGIAKDLEKLGMVSEVSPCPATVPAVKEKRAARPRILSLDLLNMGSLKKPVPKLTLTEDTPRKFFKSRAVDAPVVLTTPAVKALTAVGRSAVSKSKAFKLDTKPSRSSGRKGEAVASTPSLAKPQTFSEYKVGLASSSKKEKPYSIYEDFGASPSAQDSVTPAPAAAGRRGAGGSRTSSRKTAKEKEAAEPTSTRKPPRMASLAEAESSRPASRRKAALKRL